MPTGNAPARSRTLSAPGLLIAGGLVTAGFLDGRYVAYLNSKPAFFARIDVLLVVAATVLVTLGVAVLVRHATRRSRAFATDRPILAVIGLVGFAFAVGATTAAATGGLYREPVVLQAVGKAAGELPEVEGFMANGDMPATCTSVPDGQAVKTVFAADLGSIGGATLRAAFTIRPGSTVEGDVYIDGGDLPPDVGWPTWTGSFTVGDLAADGRRGVLTFDALTLVEDDLEFGEQPDGGPWPTTLDGSIRWACGDWSPRED